MTNGLIKGRLTYFHENGIAYQSFNTISGAKVFSYVKIDSTYRCCAEFVIDHHINGEELKLIADENEIAREIL